MLTAVRAGASCGWPRRRGRYAPRLDAGERRVEPAALLDLVVVGKITDENMNNLLLGFVDIDRSQAGKQLVDPGKQTFGVLIPLVGNGFEQPFKK